MATLKDVSTGKSYLLSPTFLVGRSRACTLELSSPKISSQHAVFHWRGEGWELRDLHSRNGTYVNQRRLAPGEAVRVCRGTSIAFGDPTQEFSVSEDEPPRALARAEDGAVVYADDEGFLALPGPEPIAISISSHDGQWFLDNDDERLVRDGDVLHAGGKPWRLELPVAVEETWQAEHGKHLRAGDIGLRFTVGGNGEFVEIDVLHGHEVTRLRSHAYHRLLLALARRRLADEASAATTRLPPSDRGWMSTKDSSSLSVSGERMLNLVIHRLRRQFGDEVGLIDARLLIERRWGGMIRIGVSRLEILS
jgi:hypothetical protein